MLPRLFRSTSKRNFPRSRTMLRLERLESRELLAGNVTAAVINGRLQVVGDSQANILTIRENGAGSYQVTGDATTINGLPAGGGNGSFAATGVGVIDVNLGSENDANANDSVTFLGDADRLTRLASNLSVRADSSLTVNVGGAFQTEFSANVTIRAGLTGSLDVSITDAGTFLGAVIIYDGEGNSNIRVNTNARIFGHFSFQGPANGASHGGNNIVEFDEATVGTFVSVVGGSGRDVLRFVGSTAGENVRLDSYDSGANTPDELIVESKIPVAGPPPVRSMVGGNLIQHGITALVRAQPASVTTLAFVNVSVVGSTVTGGVSVNNDLATGGVTTVLLGGATTVRFLSVVTAAGVDTVTVGQNASAVNITQNTIIRQGDGADSIATDNAIFAALVEMNQGTGSDTSFLQNVIGRNTTFNGTFNYFGLAEPDTVTLGTGGRVQGVGQAVFNGSANLNGGVGPGDTLDRSNADFNSSVSVIEFEMDIMPPVA